MTYNPLIPIGTDNISVDRGYMQINFQQANLLFNNDHFTFDDATLANRGYHRQVYFPEATIGNPSLGGFAGVFFCQNDPLDTSSKPQLYWKNSSNTYQISNRFRSSGSSGYWMMDNGGGTTSTMMIMMWGSASIPSSGSGTVTVTFPTMTNYTGAPTGFPNNNYNVTLGIQSSSAGNFASICIDTSGFSTTGFKLRYTGGTVASTVFWQAIGN